jgi:tRNA threonylcarbamoyl adenosine modification protein (Sua5/YciO/YrdC/YwlC family)
MATKIKIHPVTPHQKRIFEVSDYLHQGSVILFPTDSQYALGCVFDNKKGIDRIRQIRQLKEDHLMTLICDSLSGISKFAIVSDDNFKIIKRLIPGPYTFVLPATKSVPRLLQHPKRKTIGIRVPDYPICQKLVAELGDPLLSTTAKSPDLNEQNELYLDRDELFTFMDKQVDYIIDDEQNLTKQQTSIIDMTNDRAIILRRGLGLSKLEDVFSQYDKQLVEV